MRFFRLLTFGILLLSMACVELEVVDDGMSPSVQVSVIEDNGPKTIASTEANAALTEFGCPIGTPKAGEKTDRFITQVENDSVRINITASDPTGISRIQFSTIPYLDILRTASLFSDDAIIEVDSGGVEIIIIASFEPSTIRQTETLAITVYAGADEVGFLFTVEAEDRFGNIAEINNGDLVIEDIDHACY